MGSAHDRRGRAQAVVVLTSQDLKDGKDGKEEWPHALLSNAAYVIYTSGSTGRPSTVLAVYAAIERCSTTTFAQITASRF